MHPAVRANVAIRDRIYVPSATLSPEKDVSVESTKLISLSDEPWLRMTFDQDPVGGEWIEIVFEAGYLEAPIRPLLRAIGEAGETHWILPAPVLGRAIWYGRVPRDVKRWLISPTDREGPFAFRILSARRVSYARRLVRLGRLKSALMAVRLALFGPQREVDAHFRRRLMGAPLFCYAAWRDRRRRLPDWAGFDRSLGGAERPHIRFVLLGSDEARAARLRDTLCVQPFRNWSVLAPPPCVCIARVAEGLGERDFVAFVGAEDEWRPEALPILGATAAQEPVDVLYADEEIAGTPPSPWFKPSWDPLLARSVDLTGRARLFAVGYARARFADLPIEGLAERPLSPEADIRVRHVARILMRAGSRGTRLVGPAVRPPGPAPAATVIIPTRDRADLLRKCLEGLRQEEAPYAAIVVDNGSTEPAALELLRELGADRRFCVLKRPGPFNFSWLCNEAARAAHTEALVLLNNDVETIAPGWLGALLAWTRDPAVGAVAPKLLYPDGKLQHGGVVLGLEGVARHFEQGLGADDPGYFGRLNAPFAVAAVTGACLAVSREKFFAVGGFDEVNLPVELNDIDFCLRLAERGWRNMVDGAVTLIHHESASRGRTGSAQSRYPREWTYFRQRWLHRLRKDPAFPPGLSLASNVPALE